MECDLGNIKVHYEIIGEGKPIVFLHGFGLKSSHLDWLNEVENTKKIDSWQRVYLDLPGMGKTLGEDWITSGDDFLNVIIRFIHKVFPDKKIILAGNSFGGYLAQGVVYKKPEIVNGLCLAAPLTQLKRQPIVPEHTVIVENKELLIGLPSDLQEFIKSTFVIQSQEIVDVMKAYAGRPAPGEKFLSRFADFRTLSYSFDVERLPQIFNKPTLIVTGRQDSLLGYQDQWSILENYPRATFAVLDRAGHVLTKEQKNIFYTLFFEWLERIEEHMA